MWMEKRRENQYENHLLSHKHQAQVYPNDEKNTHYSGMNYIAKVFAKKREKNEEKKTDDEWNNDDVHEIIRM